VFRVFRLVFCFGEVPFSFYLSIAPRRWEPFNRRLLQTSSAFCLPLCSLSFFHISTNRESIADLPQTVCPDLFFFLNPVFFLSLSNRFLARIYCLSEISKIDPNESKTIFPRPFNPPPHFESMHRLFLECPKQRRKFYGGLLLLPVLPLSPPTSFPSQPRHPPPKQISHQD